MSHCIHLGFHYQSNCAIELSCTSPLRHLQLQLFSQIFPAVSDLHRHGFAHRGLTYESILIDVEHIIGVEHTSLILHRLQSRDFVNSSPRNWNGIIASECEESDCL